MKKIDLQEGIQAHSLADDSEPISSLKKKGGCYGLIEITIKDRNGNIVEKIIEQNIVKIFAKEMLSHRIPSSEIWDPSANSGQGGWSKTGLDVNEEFAARYILIGASFDVNGIPVENDPRYYVKDSVSGTYVPIRLEPGAQFGGGLINGIPISEPARPLKRVESISFEPTYQPAGTPLLQDDVRAMNNIVLLETTINLEEYNGFNITDSDYFVITEIALAGGRKFNEVGACECTPSELFLQGPGAGSETSSGLIPLQCIANGTDTVSINPSETEVNLVNEGDQIKIVGKNDTNKQESINQLSPFYLVINKSNGGRDMTLDRTPVDINNNPLTGAIGVYKSSLRIFSHRILKTPVKKSRDFSISILWRLIFN